MAISRSGVAVLPHRRTYVQPKPAGGLQTRGPVRLTGSSPLETVHKRVLCLMAETAGTATYQEAASDV
jgi:hypothetical protein